MPAVGSGFPGHRQRPWESFQKPYREDNPGPHHPQSDGRGLFWMVQLPGPLLHSSGTV